MAMTPTTACLRCPTIMGDRSRSRVCLRLRASFVPFHQLRASESRSSFLVMSILPIYALNSLSYSVLLELTINISSTPTRPTPFPRLVTLSTALRQSQNGHAQQRQYQRRRYSYASNAAAQPTGKTALLQDFSKFVASFTGEAEVCYQFVLRTSSVVTPEIVQASVVGDANDASSDDGCASECVLDISRPSMDKLDFGFGFEVLADPEVFDSMGLVPTVKAVSNTIQYCCRHT